jgi:hypothetical protein
MQHNNEQTVNRNFKSDNIIVNSIENGKRYLELEWMEMW